MFSLDTTTKNSKDEYMMNAWANKVIYQIYPRSFQDSSGDGIGDIPGIIEKLDYFTTLGIDAMWISPFYVSPMDDFGYDVSDYCAIEPMFGTMADFEGLVAQAHQRNLSVILDFIPSHTSTKHPWFIESASSPDNPKRDWYIWREAKPGGALPNNWVSVFGGSMWEWHEGRQAYYLHTFLRSQADLNWHNPEVKQAMADVMRFWLGKGIDGFRIDAYSHIYKHKDLADEPPNPEYVPGVGDPFESLSHVYCMNQPELVELVGFFEGVVAEFGEKFIVTEPNPKTSAELLAKLYHAGTARHAPFNFQFTTLPWDAAAYKTFIDAYDTFVGPDHTPTYVLGNHDMQRVATRIGKNAARLAAMLQLTLRGIPTIYYGEELGLENVPIPPEKVQDPFEQQVPGFGRDPERTPMEWDSSPHAGFSTHEPWLPLSAHYQTQNVVAQQADPTSFFSLYQQLLAFRKISAPLLSGTYTSFDVGGKPVFAYQREAAGQKVVVLLNFSKDEQTITLPPTEGKLVLSTSLTRPQQPLNLTSVSLKGEEGLLIEL